MATERGQQSAVRLRAISIGAVANRVLLAGGRGRVAARFERSCYVEFPHGMLCIGPRGLGNGPLNLLLEGVLPPLARDAGVMADGGVLTLGASLACDLRTTPVWSPTMPALCSPASLRDGLAAFAQALPPQLPADGLARLLAGGTAASSPVIAAALAPAQRLGDFVGRDDAATPSDLAHDIAPLLGLGPGLTPSGDDYLGGAMIALMLLGQTGKRDALWRALHRLVASHTTTISAAHLAAAAEGIGSEALHHLLDDVLAGGTASLPQALAAVAAIGHTSGWDALAGAVAVLRAGVRCTAGMPHLQPASSGCAARHFVKT